MPTSKPKKSPAQKPKPNARTSTWQVKADRPSETGRPFMRFSHSPALRQKTLVALERLEAAPDPTQHRMALADVIVELTRAGMDAYFMEPLRASKAGFITEQSAGLGMAGAVQVIASVMRNIIGSMGAPQLLSVCQSIRTFMR